MKKNIIFMGTPSFSATILKELSLEYNVVLCLTQVDKKVGRKAELTFSEVKKQAIELGIDVVQPEKLKNNLEIFNLIKNKKPDYIIVAAYGKILPKDILEIAPCINIHASLLPKYRGASPIQTSILNGDNISGITLMQMDEGMDTGDILLQEEVDISGLKSPEVFELFAQISSKLLLKYLENPALYLPKKQNNTFATYTTIIKKEDGLVTLDNAQNVYNKFLAYYDWPNIFLDNKIKLIDIAISELESVNTPGKILNINKNSIIIACEVGSIEVFYIQEPGKKILDAKTFLNGKRLKIGDLIV